jgi:hypothetical protein
MKKLKPQQFYNNELPCGLASGGIRIRCILALNVEFDKEGFNINSSLAIKTARIRNFPPLK